MGSGHWRRGHWLTPCPPAGGTGQWPWVWREPTNASCCYFLCSLRLEADDNGGMAISLSSSIYIIMAKCLFNHPPFSLITSVSFLLKTYLYETKAAAFRYLSTRIGLLLYSAKPSQGRDLGLDISNEKSNLEISSSNICLSAHNLLSFWCSHAFPLTTSPGLLSRDAATWCAAATLFVPTENIRDPSAILFHWAQR